MAVGVWKGAYIQVFGHSKQLLLSKFFDPSTPSMRKGNSGGKERRAEKRLMRIVATTSLPAVDRPNDYRWNTARSCQYGCLSSIGIGMNLYPGIGIRMNFQVGISMTVSVKYYTFGKNQSQCLFGINLLIFKLFKVIAQILNLFLKKL